MIIKLLSWIEYRLPVSSFLHRELIDYQAPRKLNYMWSLGFLSGVILLVMIITGVVLSMHYTPHISHAFSSVDRIMRDVNYGWLVRYIHMNGASLFFVVVYLHIFRGLYYGSYKSPRELLWIIGVVILLIMIITAFTGYVLPWGQMSYWGATVITNLFSAIPIIGNSIVEWLWGGFSVSNPTLNRFFSLHYLMPFLILGLIILHLAALHQHGSSTPSGSNEKKDLIPFHPYYTSKDLFATCILFLVWSLLVFFSPNFFNEPDNYTPADPLVTPRHIVPEWYFLPFYAILRCIPNKLLGVLLMFSSILVLFVVPWLDRSPIRSGRLRPLYRPLYICFVTSCLFLGWAGSQLPEGIPLVIGRLASIYYFLFFLIVMPFLPSFEKQSDFKG